MTLLVYGSYGYTGRLVVDALRDRGLRPVLAGRDRAKLAAQADRIGLPRRAFALDSAGADAEGPADDTTPGGRPRAEGVAGDGTVADALDGVSAVLNCAGPFAATADPLVEACLRTGTDYLDVTGEVPVFESVAARDGRARAAGVTLLPGVGFDVVPTDCLAATLADRLPTATTLELAFLADGGLSPGTAATAVAGLGEGGLVRRDGRLRRTPLAHPTGTVDFGPAGDRPVGAIPWGDLATAYRSTGIGNVTTSVPMSPRVARLLRSLSSSAVAGLLGAEPVNRRLRSLARRTVSGPDRTTRETGSALVRGTVRDDDARRLTALLRTPEPYALTARAAAESARRVLDGTVGTGYRTPATAFGPEFATDLDGVEVLEPPAATDDAGDPGRRSGVAGATRPTGSATTR